MDYMEQESATGLRFSWNYWPASREELTKVELPLGCMYTPLKDCKNMQLVEYEPVRCRASGCILNPFCPIDFRSKVWTCPFSMQRNTFPQHYADHMTEQNLPAELMYPTMEYILPPHCGGTCNPPAMLFVVDTVLIEEELEQLKDSLQQAISLMSSDTLVGLITFGSVAYLHVLNSDAESINSIYAFKGSKDITTASLKAMIAQRGYQAPIAPGQQPMQNGVSQVTTGMAANMGRFLLPVGECEFNILSILENLTKDTWAVPAESRPFRCTGVAISLASSLLDLYYNQSSGRVILCTGGPCTTGPGQVVDLKLSESMRHHLDLQKDTQYGKHVKKALSYYTSLANRAVVTGHTIDIYACSLDQVGLYEMRVLSDKTGGNIVMCDSFSINVFKNSFKKFFSCDNYGYNAKLNVLCSQDFKVAGAIGCCTSTNKKTIQVSDTVIGQGGSSEWQIGSMNNNSTIAFYFDVTGKGGTSTSGYDNQGGGKGNYQTGMGSTNMGFIQFQTLYQHPNGRKHLRVTTAAYRFSEPNIKDVATGFEQEAAVALMARLAVNRAETEEPINTLRWLDRKLIRLISRFADYQKDDVNTFHLSNEFATYPQYMYHLRRSHFLQTFNASPDETAFYRSLLLRENVMNSLLMIQPALLEYSFASNVPKCVLLDSQSLKGNVILLLDTFFHVVIWYGEQIHHWKTQNYHLNPEYQNFKELLESANNDVQEILQDRFPTPKFVQCSAGGSQARFLLAKVNPSTSYASTREHTNLQLQPYDQPNDAAINTDDVSLKVFMQHLIKLSVQS